jgi:hypothetical protein
MPSKEAGEDGIRLSTQSNRNNPALDLHPVYMTEIEALNFYGTKVEIKTYRRSAGQSVFL